MKAIITSIIITTVLLTGCATDLGPDKTVISENLEAEHLIYFEQVDRVPKDVLLESFKQAQFEDIELSNMPVEYSALIKELIGVVPEINESYSAERQSNVLFGRRILFRGYGTNSLVAINEIIKSFGLIIENISSER